MTNLLPNKDLQWAKNELGIGKEAVSMVLIVLQRNGTSGMYREL